MEHYCDQKDCNCYINGNTPYDFSGATTRLPAVGQFLNPFVPLNEEEIAATAAAVKLSPAYISLYARNPKRVGLGISADSGVLFSYITLQEPPKAYVNSWNPLQGTKRVAQTLIYGMDTNESWQFLSDLNNNNIFRSDQVAVIPPLDTFAEPANTVVGLTTLLADDPQVIESLQKRGLTRADLFVPPGSPPGTVPKVQFFSNPFETLVDKLKKNKQCCQEIISSCDGNKRLFYLTFTLTLVQPPFQPPNAQFPDVIENAFFSFIDGLIVIVDATNQRIFKVVDEYCVPLPFLIPDPVAYDTMQHKLSMNPINITQPMGPSFNIEGNEIEWDNWKLKYNYHPRTGVQLYDIKYFDSLATNEAGQHYPHYRDVMYKLSIDESGVYYNVQEPLFARGFISTDSDSYPLLPRVQTQLPGLDAPAYAEFRDIFYTGLNGESIKRERAISIFEQLGKPSYRGLNVFVPNCENHECVPVGGTCIGKEYLCQQSGAVDQELVIRFYFSGVLYLWTFSYVFSPLGSIRVDIDVSARAFYDISHSPSESQPWSHYITKNRLAFDHTHYWNIRADFKVDGELNTVHEHNQYRIEAQCGECGENCQKNPNICGQTIENEHIHLSSELDAIRDQNVQTNRVWHVVNPNKKNRLGQNVGYEILPIMNLNTSKANSTSWPTRNNSFLNHALHVTKYNDCEQFAAGNFPIMACEDVGLGKYVQKNENIENTDIVVWYTVIYSHSPHTEDQPFVPTKSASLLFSPDNFFEINPAYGLKTLIGNNCAAI